MQAKCYVKSPAAKKIIEAVKQQTNNQQLLLTAPNAMTVKKFKKIIDVSRIAMVATVAIIAFLAPWSF